MSGTLSVMDAAHALWLTLAALLTMGGALRVTRFVTSDTLGGWMLRDPAYRWAMKHEEARRFAVLQLLEERSEEENTAEAQATLDHWEQQLSEDDPMSWQMRLVSGLYCPFCVGFWISAAVLLGSLGVLALGVAWLSWTWWILLGAATLNYVTGHISAKID